MSAGGAAEVICDAVAARAVAVPAPRGSNDVDSREEDHRTHHSQRATVFNNGAFESPVGSGLSVVQSSLGLTTFGYGAQIVAGNNILADDFTLASPTLINSITFYAYQTASTTISTITGVFVRIVTGNPINQARDANPVVFGDLSTNRMTSTSFTGVYRVSETTLTNTQRPIMSVQAQIGLTLAAGTYWIQWGFMGSGALTGPWQVPVAITGVASTDAGLQSAGGGAWLALDEPQAFAFFIDGVTAGTE